MTRKLFPSLILIGIFGLTFSAAADTVRLGENNADAAAATNGSSTLVVWTQIFTTFSNNWSVYMRVLDSPFDRNAIRLDRGYRPSVATNGRQYLVGYSDFGSRLNHIPLDNVLVQLVSPEGVKLGPRRVINQSIIGSLASVEWNGTHWLVVYHTGASSHVAFLDESLNVIARLDLGLGTLVALEEIDGRWWAMYRNSSSVEAVELRPDGTTGARFSKTSLPVTAHMHLTHGVSPLLLMQSGDHVDAMPFDPFTGFGEPRPFLQSTRLIDVESYEGGSLVLVASSNARYDTLFINAAGEVGPQLPLLEVSTQWAWTILGPSKNGLSLFTTPGVTFPVGTGELFVYRVPPARAPIDPASARLVSQVSIPDRRRSVRH